MSYVLPCALGALVIFIIVRCFINKLPRLIEMTSLANVFRVHYFLYWGSISAVLNFSVLFILKHGDVGQDQTGDPSPPEAAAVLQHLEHQKLIRILYFRHPLWLPTAGDAFHQAAVLLAGR